MRHTQIQPRSMMNEIMIAPQPERRATERLRLDASVNLASSIRKDDIPTHARVTQYTHRAQTREPIWIDHLPPRAGYGVAASLDYNSQLHTSIGKLGPAPSSSSMKRSTTPSATSSRNSSLNASLNNNNNNASINSSMMNSRNINNSNSDSAALQQQSDKLLQQSLSVVRSNTMNRSLTPTLNRSQSRNVLANQTFGDASNLLTPRSGRADFNRTMMSGTTHSIHATRLNTTKRPSELLGGIKQSADWAYALRNENIEFKNKKPPPGFRGKGKPRVLPRKASEDDE